MPRYKCNPKEKKNIFVVRTRVSLIVKNMLI